MVSSEAVSQFAVTLYNAQSQLPTLSHSPSAVEYV
jgi:hypothetical protein